MHQFLKITTVPPSALIRPRRTDRPRRLMRRRTVAECQRRCQYHGGSRLKRMTAICSAARGMGREPSPCWRAPGRTAQAHRDNQDPAPVAGFIPASGHAPLPRHEPISARGFRLYQEPVFSMLVQGSAGASAVPACSSSMEMPSGVRTNAIRPSRGGRLIVTPWAMSALQVS